MKDKPNYDGHGRKAGVAKRKRQARVRRNRRNNKRNIQPRGKMGP